MTHSLLTSDDAFFNINVLIWYYSILLCSSLQSTHSTQVTWQAPFEDAVEILHVCGCNHRLR